MVYAIDKFSSQHDWDIVAAFDKRYQQPDPFWQGKGMSSPIPTEDIKQQPHKELDYQCLPTELVMVDILNPPDILLKSISVNEQNNGPEKEVYFYHSDHLGSANWITDHTGSPIQYIHYAPYGELIENQMLFKYDERYKFTGKERDWETGYDMFGARYLWSPLGWTSVDPLSDKYPGISPYAYCAWNPVKFVDPDGRYFDEANEGIAQKIEAELLTKKIYSALGDGNQMRELYSTWKDIKDMRNDTKHEFRFESTSAEEPGPATKSGGTNANGDQIINMYSHLEKLDGTTAHEARHGGQVARREMFYDNMGNPQNYGVMKEVDAYKAQWGWDGFLKVYGLNNANIPEALKPSYHGINPGFVNSITEGLSLTPLYPPMGYSIKLWNNH